MRLDCCPKRRECGMKDYNYSCDDCFASVCYNFGFCEGARQAVNAMCNVKSALLPLQVPLSAVELEEFERVKREVGR